MAFIKSLKFIFSHKISIKWRIFVYLIGFCLLLLGILWAFQIIFLDTFYKRIKSTEIKQDAENIGSYVTSADWRGLGDIIARRDDLFVEVWSANTDTIMVTQNYPNGIQAVLSYRDKLSLFWEINNSGSSVIRRYIQGNTINHRKRESESIMYSTLISSQNGNTWLLMVSANISPVDATVDTLQRQLYFISGVMLFLSVVIAFLIANRVSRPIRQLNNAAAELGRGNYNADFNGFGYKEISQLSDTLSKAAAELSKTEALRQELIANVSHDLRTPLTLITGYSEMIKDLPGENTPDNMQVIIDESVRLTSLVNDLLDFPKMQAGVTGMTFSYFPLTQSINEIINRFSRFKEKENYSIEFFYDCEVEAYADSSRISQVIYNLLINAMTYTGDDKKVTIHQHVENGKAVIRIADTGAGIPAEKLPYIWDRYYRVEEVHRRSVTGSGLGLSITKTILDKHINVEYGVESEMGRGSVFWFSLPLSEE